VVLPRFRATVANHELSARMNPLQLSPEQWRFALLIGVLVFYKSAYNLFAQIMDRVTSTSSKPTSPTHLKSPNSSDRSTSPRMSPFHRRFRSSVSNAISDHTSNTESTDSLSLTKTEAARSAKRFLLSTIRDDWAYPSPEPEPAQQPIHREPLAYRIREEGSSDPEPLSDEPYDARDPMVFTDSDPYKFENPNAVARTIGERKRKRQRLFREELEWNDGLRTWVDCRDAWCGAVKRRPKKRAAKLLDHQDNGCSPSGATGMSIPLSPLSHLSATSSSVPSASESEDGGKMESPEGDRGSLLPVYPSLLPEDNSIRASIQPRMYPAIYSKVVLQSLTPTVPVPLPDIIGALVQGWKSEGDWPPKGTTPATSIIQVGGRRASELLKFRRRENAVAEKGRMRKGVGAVKKALGLRTSNGETNRRGLKLADEGCTRNSSFEQSGLVEEDVQAPA